MKEELMKRLATVALAVLVVASLSTTVLAERTALSIGGKIELMAAYEEGTGSGGVNLGDGGNDNRVEEKINLDVDADMTDNISVHLGLEQTGAWGGTIDGQAVGLAVDEAYLVVKELIIEQITVKAGVMTTEYSLRNDGNAMFLSLPELGAWKTTLNYDPLYVDLIIATLAETRNTAGAMDTALYALAVEYYLENKGKVQVILFTMTNDDADTSLVEYSAGCSYMVMADLEVFVQLGAQSGSVADVDAGCMAYNLGCEYTFAKVPVKPYVGLSYQAFGGDDTDLSWVNFGDVDETIVLEADRDLRDHGLGKGKILTTNYTVIRVVGGAVIDEKTNVDAGIGMFSLSDDGVGAGVVGGGDADVGTEIDVKVSHKLTDDLTLAGGVGYVMSGDAIENSNVAAESDNLVVLYVTATLNF
jgi:hypothetical protein